MAEAAAESAKIKAALRTLGEDGEDVIGAEDLRQVLKTVGSGQLTDSEIDTILSLMDKNGDKKVDVSKFVDWAMWASGAEVPDAGPGLEAEQPAEAVRRLQAQLGSAVRVCILGGTAFQGAGTEELTAAVAAQLSQRLQGRACFVTGGMEGVQQVFARHCSEGAQVWNLLPLGQASGYGTGEDVCAGADLKQRMEVTGALGDLYLTMEGGPGVAAEARQAHERGARVLPLVRTGGASSGMFSFPAEALKPPAGVSQEQWALLERKDAPVADSVAAFVAVAEKLVDAIAAQQRAAPHVERLRAELGPGVRVCILGGTAFHGADSEGLVQAVARELAASLGSRAAFVTGGMAGVQKAFALHCGDGSRVWNLLPEGQASDFGVGKDVHAGADLEQRKEVFGLLGDVYVTVEGGPGVAQEARAASARGAAVLPLLRTGGASAGKFDFPAAALERPSCASEEQWALLSSSDAPVSETAVAVAAIVERLVARYEG
mmetsp:Transcript_77338/g.240311  ORF Transcript_77338/g.240311 Transcript_77338/m.240311 type:complete len:489 (-) Transcript_77338:36-1502(-)